MSEYIEHRTQAGDRWDLLAWKYYGEATAYEPIIAANPSVAITPVLPAGTLLLIPVIAASQPGVSNRELPPWLT